MIFFGNQISFIPACAFQCCVFALRCLLSDLFPFGRAPTKNKVAEYKTMSSVTDNASVRKRMDDPHEPDYSEFQTAPVVATDDPKLKFESPQQQQQESGTLAERFEIKAEDQNLLDIATSVKVEADTQTSNPDNASHATNKMQPLGDLTRESTEEHFSRNTKQNSNNQIQSFTDLSITTSNLTNPPPPSQPNLEKAVEPVISHKVKTKSIQTVTDTTTQFKDVKAKPAMDAALNEISQHLQDEKTMKEEETETVHLHESPQNSLTKKQSFGESTLHNSNSKGNNLLQFQHQSQQLKPHVKIEETDDIKDEESELQEQKIQAYAMLDFESFTFYIQTMQILLGRMVEGDSLTDALDIHLGNQKAISRRHAKIFYNFGNQRFELSILGRNGAFVEGNFVEKGVTVPLQDGTKIQIGATEFAFILPKKEGHAENEQRDNELEIETRKLPIKPEPIMEAKPKDIHLENIDKLVANFDDIKKDLELDKSLLPNTPQALGMLDDDHEKRELEIEQEIGRVLAREHGEQIAGLDDPNNDKKSKKKATKAKADVDGKNKSKRQPKAKKKVYTLEEIPEEYRNKPNLPYSVLITDCLRKRGTDRGMSLSEIYKGIQELYPYYFYCPDGWQSSVRHNLSLNKSFKKISKEGKGWLWGVNEEVIAEKDRARQKQLENAKAKGKLSAKTLPRTIISNPQSFSSASELRPPNPNIPIQITNYTVPQQHNQTQQQLQHTQQFQNRVQQNPNMHKQQPILSVQPQQPMQTKIQHTQETNRTGSGTGSSGTFKPDMNANTKRALAYLQKELISLTKSRKMYDRATSTEILTKALAMTISQVDQAAKNFAIKGFPLVTLIDKNPGHVTKILTAALNAATLQVCKQKGLTPHLPPKNLTPTSSSAANTTVKQESTGKQVSAGPITTQLTSTGSPSGSVKPPSISLQQHKLVNKLKIIPQQPGADIVSNHPIVKPKEESEQPFVPKPVTQPSKMGKGPMVYQFSKSNTVNGPATGGSTSTSTSTPVAPSTPSAPAQLLGASSTIAMKPQFKPPIMVKPSFKPHGVSSSISGANIKPVKLGGETSNSGASSMGIVKPQFYTKGKNPTTSQPQSVSPVPTVESVKKSHGKVQPETGDVVKHSNVNDANDDDDGSDLSDADGELDMMLADLEKDVDSSDDEGEKKRSIHDVIGDNNHDNNNNNNGDEHADNNDDHVKKPRLE